MARSFASASSQYLRYTGTIGGEAYTVAGWVYRASSGASHAIFSRCNASNTLVQLFLFNPSNVLQYYYESLLPGTVNISGATSISNNTWYHVAAVMQSGEHRIYLNGVSEAVATNALVSRDNTYTQISGRVYAGSGGEYFNGRMAEFGIWSTGLTAAEVAGLAKGRDVSTVRPASLAAYYPMGGRYNQSDVDRWKSKLDLTATGSPTWTDHPRIVYPQVMGLPSKGSGGGGGVTSRPYAYQSARMIGAGR